ncbi:MAG: hypothetical protein IH876_13635, partial [Gemmatimonadetes bacterium]|nr:hypothetical protein [Gemmatimonadota bacterium]
MTVLSAQLPSIANAQLPEKYEAAKTALAECARIDECKDWADKAHAIASYAKQADDTALLHHVRRIQGRAVRRCGELLKEFDGRGGDRSKRNGADTSAPTQRDMAEQAGLSKRQQVTAVRVANVPKEEFEAVVESDDPPSVTKLADMGRREHDILTSPKPPGFQAATELQGTTAVLPARLSGGAAGGPSLVPQAHGGALLPGGTPEGRLKGKQVIAERRRARAERSEAVDDAMVGHVEKMSDIIGDLVEQAGGEQHRCANCGAMGPKVPKLKLKEATEVAAILMRAVKQPDTAATVIPIQINVHAGA